ncbi:MAG: hypothetical protein M3Q55_07225 [Acidobacteriota bacterium]|nr:hypothetical protein [Acidobacteriota bacterium]
MTQPVRRLLMMTLAAVFAVSTAAAAQEPAATAPQAPATADPMKFDSGIAMVLNEVKPDKVADFEAVWTAIKAGLAASPKPEHQAQAASLKMLKLATPLPAGSNALYIFAIDPVASGMTYDPVKILFESGAFERAKADELYARVKDAYARITPWPLVIFGS